MIVDFVSEHYLSVTLDPEERARVLRDLSLDVHLQEVCKISVNILLWPIDKRDLHARITEPGGNPADSSLELFPTG